MARIRNSSFTPPGHDADPRDLIWWRAFTELDKAMSPYNLTAQDAARLFGITPNQVIDIVGREDKKRNPTAITLQGFALSQLPEGMHRPNAYYIITGHERTPEHERCIALIDVYKEKVAALQKKVGEQAEAIIRLTKNL